MFKKSAAIKEVVDVYIQRLGAGVTPAPITKIFCVTFVTNLGQ